MALGLAFMGAGSFTLSQPGHDVMLHTALVRIELQPAYQHVKDTYGMASLSYADFIADAGFYLGLAYDGDFDRVMAMLDRIGASTQGLCITPPPSSQDEDDPQRKDNHSSTACHAVCSNRPRLKKGAGCGLGPELAP